MKILKLTISQFGDFGFATLLVSDLEHIYYFIVELGLVVDYLGLEVIHHLFIYCLYILRKQILLNKKESKVRKLPINKNPSFGISALDISIFVDIIVLIAYSFTDD